MLWTRHIRCIVGPMREHSSTKTPWIQNKHSAVIWSPDASPFFLFIFLPNILSCLWASSYIRHINPCSTFVCQSLSMAYIYNQCYQDHMMLHFCINIIYTCTLFPASTLQYTCWEVLCIVQMAEAAWCRTWWKSLILLWHTFCVFFFFLFPVLFSLIF